MDNKMIANNLEPAYLTHPGEVVKDEIEYRGISQRKQPNATSLFFLGCVVSARLLLSSEQDCSVRFFVLYVILPHILGRA